MSATFTLDARQIPAPADPAIAQKHFQEWSECLIGWQPDALQSSLILSVFGNSPFLSQSLKSESQLLQQLFRDGPDSMFTALLTKLQSEENPLASTEVLKSQLRIARRRASLIIALADIANCWQLEQVTGALSALAQLAVQQSVRHLLSRAHQSGELMLPDPDHPELASGLVVLAMGKLGARELNYSSDIDLMVFYDSDKVDYRGRRSIQEMFVRMVRELVGILEDRTGDGYVFRVDLRLRPDPGATPVAVSVLAAETYYEGSGQNWERAALIKARQIAGDEAAGAAFFDFLRSFIWRKHLDFAAIQDIHSIKRQITAHKGGGKIAVAGHNIKLGRGGIREIEFFAQTQLLIWGGRDPNLRQPGTCQALAALASAGHLDPQAAKDLTDAYGFLRRVEHRLQMIDDQQTQTLPADPLRLRAVAVFLGYEDSPAFAAALTAILQTVEAHYARLFEDGLPLDDSGNLVFTGTEAEPETLKTIEGMGFKAADAISRQIRSWHHGRVKATRSTRAREILTELTPTLLKALANTADPDAAFLRFDSFLSRLPAGVQLFSLFANNPALLDLVAEIMGDAPRMADWLAANPSLLYGVLSADFFAPPGSAAELTLELDLALAQSNDFQEMLDVARRWTNEQKFRVGVHILRGLTEPPQAGRHLSDLAEAALAALQPRVEAEFARIHGCISGGSLAIVAMGKMGSQEMTAISDLDLILVYDTPDPQSTSDGAKPLSASAYYARLTQRIINAITAKTGEGTLYEVDMRLRPSGNAGPIATSLPAFVAYQADSAWTWEHMALTRARVITGSPALRQSIESTVTATLTAPRDAEKLRDDVADMRRRMAAELHDASAWDVKHQRGGLVDLEFIVQYLKLRWAHTHPSVLRSNTSEALQQMIALGLIDPESGEHLLAALRLWTTVQQLLRQTIEGAFRETHAPKRLRDILVHATGNPHFEALKISMAEHAHRVIKVYSRLIDSTALLKESHS
ncbi:MAG TPA: bifunctional [glutamine synthetase] adenylyltransferase/[glutamine synthetase]-adenylyl-L-tyrosine phosphorylase [Rhodospirillaceae bacterium]|nr:bifunctional [glutamine synthetase] adenylyltransferase/[glutamine synthetase]-adenylyl-L-tyrosine phosphorylase [Rhodospirillaceae bacterium]